MGENENHDVTPAGGDGPPADGPWSQKPYTHPAAGWGAAISVTEVLWKTREMAIWPRTLYLMNKPRKGFDCPGCAWPDAIDGTKLDFCENGVKHVAWELTKDRTTREFFAAHTVTELESWTDTELEAAGRLTEPMVYDPESDKYVPISWSDAFALFGDHVRRLESPDQGTYYTSGRLGNEATFLYQLMIRELGTNNMPDCSNMCHEASGRALQAAIGTGKGTADLKDWDTAEAIFVIGINAASNAPRMLTHLTHAYKRGAQIVHVNPLIEAGATDAIIPHEVVDMVLDKKTPTSTLNLQVRPGGDMALVRGMAKAVFELATTDPTALDPEFIARYTAGFEDYKALVESTSWSDIVDQSGLTQGQIRQAAGIYTRSHRTIFSWCLGITQHEHGVSTIREIMNLLLMRGNLGREGAGPSPVRGHSNVQGNRTCGIDNHPTKAWLDRMAEATGITPPYEHGLDTVGTLHAMKEGKIKVFVGMGGNFVLAAPDTPYAEEGMRSVDLSVQVSTKLNRSHIVHGKAALILPCIGRTERDEQRSGPQSISCEDGMAIVHLSQGIKEPASPHLLSEPAIIAGLAKAALPDSTTPWDWYVEDYDRIRDVMAKALFGFEDFNRRVRHPGGFRIKQPARELIFLTPTGKAEFHDAPLPDHILPEGMLTLQTMRSHDQWNTSIYSDDDRYRGVKNLRTLILMNELDMAERGLSEGDLVDIESYSRDGTTRRVHGYRALRYNLPRGSAAGYMPELNVLVGIADVSTQSDQPIMKNVRVRVTPMGTPATESATASVGSAHE